MPIHAASSCIAKPDNANPERFPFCPANETFCLALARAAGIDAPAAELMHLPEPVFLIDRFDREVTVNEVAANNVTANNVTVNNVAANEVRRLHQIDLCQLLNKWPGYKYESDGGATFSDVFKAMDQTRQPAASRNRLFRWIVFNYLIGNSDAHAKNISFLVGPKGISLAPAYDLLSVAVYGSDYDYMAMTIAGESRYGWVERAQWEQLCALAGVRPAFLSRLRRELAQRVPRLAREIITSKMFTDDERHFLDKVVDVIDTHAGYLAETV